MLPHTATTAGALSQCKKDAPRALTECNFEGKFSPSFTYPVLDDGLNRRLDCWHSFLRFVEKLSHGHP